MPIRDDQTAWSPAEVNRLRALSAEGTSAATTAIALNAEFHGGEAIRSVRSVGMKRTHAGIMVAAARREPERTAPPTGSEQEVQRTQHADGSLEILAVGRRIRTVEEAIAHVEADMTRFDIGKISATSWDTTLVDPTTKKARTVQNHRVFVQLVPKVGLNTREQVEALIAGAFATRKPLAQKAHKKQRAADLLQATVIADPHFGKYAWDHETGHGNYDIDIASRLVRDGAAELLAWGDREGAGRRAIWLLGDVFHFDTPQGATTGGTALDRDGRLERMLTEAQSVLFDIIAAAAERGQVDVEVIPGNHDAVLSVTLRLTLAAYFRADARVRVGMGGTTRKYVTHGKCLVGLAHGDKAQKQLGALMSAEARAAWGGATLREVHHGHRHSEALVTTQGGVTIRQHPALCPPDGWHAAEGYVGAPRAMDGYLYHADGYLVGTRRSSVRVGR